MEKGKGEKTLWICYYMNERCKMVTGIIYTKDRAEAESIIEARQERDGKAISPISLVEHPDGAIVNGGFYPGKVIEETEEKEHRLLRWVPFITGRSAMRKDKLLHVLLAMFNHALRPFIRVFTRLKERFVQIL
jgi:hypothetical protein